MSYFGPDYRIGDWIDKGYVKLVKTKTSICDHFVFKSCPESLKSEMREQNKKFPHPYLFEEDLTEEELKAIKPCDGKPY